MVLEQNANLPAASQMWQEALLRDVRDDESRAALQRLAAQGGRDLRP